MFGGSIFRKVVISSVVRSKSVSSPKLNVFPQIAAMDVPEEELQTDLSQESSIQQCQIDNELVKNKAELHRRLLQHIPDVPDTEERPMPSFTAEGIR